jgi:hypothetical protein
MEGLIISFLFGLLCALIANSKGRSAIGWFFIGFFITCIGLIIILCLSNVKEEKEYREGVSQENRRLREQLRQEKMKSEAFRRHAAQRLDSHDRQLGVDTRAAGGSLADDRRQMVTEAPPAEADPASHASLSDRWYYESGGSTMGPVSASDVRRMLRSGQLRGASLLCREGADRWTAAELTPEFKHLT